MKNFRASHIKGPDVWETSLEGCLVALGLPFLLLGLLGVAAALGLVRAEEAAPWHVLLSAGVVSFAVGVIFVFGKGGVVIDRRKKKVVKWFGLGMPLMRKEFGTDSFEFVTLTRKMRSDKDGPNTVYPVGLKGPTPGPLVIEVLGEYKAARSVAEELAGFLAKPLEDSSTGTPVLIEPEPPEMAEGAPVSAAFSQKAPYPDLPEAPPALCSRIYSEGVQTTVEIPARGFDAGGYLSLAVGTVVPGVMVYGIIIPFIRQMDSSGDFLILTLLYLFTIIPTFLTWSGAIRAAKKTVSVHASPLGLSVDEMGVFKARSIDIPAHEIEEIFVSGSLSETGEVGEAGGQIIVKVDKGIIFFGHGLSTVELKYLRAVIKRAIAG